ncbi:putative DNA binding protein [Collybia nuda]|uniref:DNA binding protein n=1 Tax=Collybia nuda TaxID=64659 RepID=A0A9P5Y2K5_9AGAR|nr:putative DNA binding protein [Collybia nuda]
MARTKLSARKSIGGKGKTLKKPTFPPGYGEGKNGQIMIKSLVGFKYAHKALSSSITGTESHLHHSRPGTVALREIRKFQKSTKHLIPKLPMQRLIREIAAEYKDDLQFQPSAIEALHEACEAYIAEYLNHANLVALHAKRVTIQPKDMELVKKIRGQSL